MDYKRCLARFILKIVLNHSVKILNLHTVYDLHRKSNFLQCYKIMMDDGFNVNLELQLRLLPTVLDSFLKMIGRHDLTILVLLRGNDWWSQVVNFDGNLKDTDCTCGKFHMLQVSLVYMADFWRDEASVLESNVIPIEPRRLYKQRELAPSAVLPTF